jgi:hypothetical protein
MNFKARLDYILFARIGFISIWIFLGCLQLTTNNYHYYAWCASFSTALILAVQFYRPIYALLFTKPILTVNETYVYDFVTNTSYYWRDIEDITQNNRSLYINLENPDEYLKKTGAPLKKFARKLWYKPGKNQFLLLI